MSDHIYKQIELTGSSKSSVKDAIQNAIGRNKRHCSWSIHRNAKFTWSLNRSNSNDGIIPEIGFNLSMFSASLEYYAMPLFYSDLKNHKTG